MKKPLQKACPGVLGRLIRKAREHLGFTQEELATRIGLSNNPVNVSRWENAKYYVPWFHWKKLSEVLEIPWEEWVKSAKKDDPDSAAYIQKFLKEFSLEGQPGTGGKNLFNIPEPLVKKLEQIQKQKAPKAHLPQLVEASVEFFVDNAWRGLDANFHPYPSTEEPKKKRLGRSG